jgi:hypothetical protein
MQGCLNETQSDVSTLAQTMFEGQRVEILLNIQVSVGDLERRLGSVDAEMERASS